MHMHEFPFEMVDWTDVKPTQHSGQTGTSTWRTRQWGKIRVRLVEYSAGYLADHWCSKGHIVFCLEGEMDTELADGRVFKLTPGKSYQVGDGASSHRSTSAQGAKLFIVD